MRVLILALCFWASVAGAVEVDEILPDPALEARARQISLGLRCPVCRNESIDDSHAGVAKDLRVLVRDRLLAGDSDAEVVDYIVDRYGEYVLLTPRKDGANLVLWAAGPVLLLLGLGIGWRTIRRRPAAAPDPLSDEEQEALDRILRS